MAIAILISNTLGQAGIHAPTASPPGILAGTQTVVVISTYIPDSSLIASSVNLITMGANGATPTPLGLLHDDGSNGDATAGDHVYSIRTTFLSDVQVDLRITAAFRGVLRRQTATLSIPIIAVPAIGTPIEYNNNITGLFNAALSARAALTNITSGQPTTASDTILTLTQSQQNLVNIFVRLRSIIAFESSQPPSAVHGIQPSRSGDLRAATVGVFPGGDAADAILTASQKTGSTIDRIKLFGADGTDPRVADIASYCHLSVDLTDPAQMEERELCARTFELQLSNSTSWLSTISASAHGFAVKNLLEPASDLLGQGVSGLLHAGTLATQAITGVTGTILQFFTIPQASASGIMVSTVANPSTIQSPAGINTIIYAFGGAIGRALFRNLNIMENTGSGLLVVPGTVSDLGVGSLTTGRIVVRATVDGVAWAGAVRYSVNSNVIIDGNVVPNTTFNGPLGSYTVTYTSGGPQNSSFNGVSPSSNQNLLSGQVITFTLQFKRNPPTWLQKVLSVSPAMRRNPSIAYDVARGLVVLFGGDGNPGSPSGCWDDTWIWDGVRWSQLNPPSMPSPRGSAATAYDAARGQVVLFGGWDNSVYHADTWIWDGTTWVQKVPSTSPPWKGDPAMAYDAARGQVVMFGGYSLGGDTNDTWVWDGANWKVLTPATLPPTREGHAMAYDAARSQVVMFGGVHNDIGSSQYLSDTWLWDGTNWRLATPSSAPPAQKNARMVYDTVTSQILLFSDEGGYPLNGLWAWDGSNWNQLAITSPTPPVRFRAGVAFDGIRGQLVMFGGNNLSGALNDTWVLGRFPTAGFTMSSGIQTTNEGHTLNLTVPSGGMAAVNLDGGRSIGLNGAPITGWQWTVDGTGAGNTPALVRTFSVGSHAISLIVTDNMGIQSGQVGATLRVREVIYTPINYPGAYGTNISGINSSGTIVGGYTPVLGAWSLGFIRNGATWTSVTYPGSVFTAVTGINDLGQVVGVYSDAQSVSHCFVLSGAVFTSIDYPGAHGTSCSGLNNAGTIVGTWSMNDSSGTETAFTKDSSGFASFRFPGQRDGTKGAGINSKGQVVGSFYLPYFGYLKDGLAFTSVEYPRSGFQSYTIVNGINDVGSIVGTYDGNNVGHGFLKQNGAFMSIDYPGVSAGGFTVVTGINSLGVIVGYYYLPGVSHDYYGFTAQLLP